MSPQLCFSRPSNHRISIDWIFSLNLLSHHHISFPLALLFIFFPFGSDHSLTPIGVQEQGWGSHDISRIMLKRKNEEVRLSRPPHSQAEQSTREL